jgi:hypothetical protein
MTARRRPTVYAKCPTTDCARLTPAGEPCPDCARNQPTEERPR